MVKKVVAILLVLTMVFTLTGCDVSNIFSYWDGMTKSQVKEYICKELEEKYGEEFEVVSMGIRSGQYYKEIVGTCSPKSDETIAFDFEVNHFSEIRQMRDNYIQNIVRKQLKQNIDEVLSAYCDNFASEVYVTPLTKLYDSGIRSAGDTSVKSFSESFKINDKDDANETSAWIVLDANFPIDIELLKDIIHEMVTGFHSLNVCIDCFFTDQATIDLCNEKANSISADRWEVQIITRNGDFRCDRFIYYNDDRGLLYIGNNLY